MSKEIHYCDKCGDIMQGKFDPQAQTMCLHCQGSAPGGASAPPSMPSMPTEEIGGSMTATLERSLEAPGEMSLEDVVGNEGLDLYSPDTVAIRKKADDQAKSSSGRLRFAENAGPAKPRTEPTPGGTLGGSLGAPAAASPTAQPAAAPNAGQTMHAQATTLAATAASATLATQGAVQATASQAPVLTPDGKWKLQCVHCQGRLAVPPVQRKSKLRCPRCSGEQALDPTGRLQGIKGGAKKQPVAGSPTVAHLDDSPAAPADFAPPPAQPAMTTPSNPALSGPVPAPPEPAAGSPAAVAAELAQSLYGPAAGDANPFPASPPPMAPLAESPSAFDLADPTSLAIGEEGYQANESDGLASALLGGDQAFTEEQLSATLGQVRSEEKGVPVENAILWIILTSLPSFVGLYAVSELAGPEVQNVIWNFGEGVQGVIQEVHRYLGKFF